MTQNYINADQNQAESQAIVKSDKNSNGLTIKGKGSLLALTNSIISSAIAERQASQLAINDDWVERIWAWADEFELTEKQIPRNKEDLIKLESLDIEMCCFKDLESLLEERTEAEESWRVANERIQSARERGLFIGGIPPEFIKVHDLNDKVRHLERLLSTTNKMNSIPIELSYLKNLITIVLWGVESSNFLKNAQLFSNLKTFVAINCNVNNLFDEICQLKQLTDIIIRGSEIINIPQSISQLSNLTKLSVSTWESLTIHEDICKLTKLTELNITNCNLLEIPEAIFQLKNLTELSINSCKSLEIHKDICKLIKLTELNITNCNLLEIPEAIFQLKNLNRLNIAGNDISTLPKNISKLKDLTSLNISNNYITTLPTSMCLLESLISLHIDVGILKDLPKHRYNQALEGFDIKVNAINNLPLSLKLIEEHYFHGKEDLPF